MREKIVFVCGDPDDLTKNNSFWIPTIAWKYNEFFTDNITLCICNTLNFLKSTTIAQGMIMGMMIKIRRQESFLLNSYMI